RGARRWAIVQLAANSQLYNGRTGGTGGMGRMALLPAGPAHPARPALSPVRVLSNLVLLEFLVKIAARRPDHLGGLRDVPAVFAQLGDQERSLGVLLELPQRARPVRVAFRSFRRSRR